MSLQIFTGHTWGGFLFNLSSHIEMLLPFRLAEKASDFDFFVGGFFREGNTQTPDYFISSEKKI